VTNRRLSADAVVAVSVPYKRSPGLGTFQRAILLRSCVLPVSIVIVGFRIFILPALVSASMAAFVSAVVRSGSV
jgi:hypothetical protein